MIGRNALTNIADSTPITCVRPWRQLQSSVHPLILAALLGAQPDDTAAPVKFDTLTLKGTERLDGATVTIRVTITTPAVTRSTGANLRTVVGPADRGDVAEWTVFLKGNRLCGADDGTKLTVTSRFRVIKHPAAVVGGVRIGAWTEVRVIEWEPRPAHPEAARKRRRRVGCIDEFEGPSSLNRPEALYVVDASHQQHTAPRATIFVPPVSALPLSGSWPPA